MGVPDASTADDPITILGYSDPLSVAAGHPIRFMVSTTAPRYSVEIVRLVQGDDQPAGPGFRAQTVPASCTGEYQGRHQEIATGSFVQVQPDELFLPERGVTLQTWFLSTTPGQREQALLSTSMEDRQPAYGAVIGVDGHVRFQMVGVDGRSHELRASAPLVAGLWYFLLAMYDAHSGEARLMQRLVAPAWNLGVPFDDRVTAVFPSHLLRHTEPGLSIGAFPAAVARTGLSLAARILGSSSSGFRAVNHFNGRLEGPRVFRRALSDAEAEESLSGTTPSSAAQDIIASWDFSIQPSSALISDTSPNSLHGRAINAPLRAVRGHSWDGTETDFRNVPAQYAAIHFHDDDLEDAEWSVDFELLVPETFASGVYAARLSADGSEDYVPFFVRPQMGRPTADIAVLMPTLTYMAYANERFYAMPLQDWSEATERPLVLSRQDRYIADHPELGISTYDLHSDGSAPACYSSRLRPIMNMRPQMVSYWNQGGRHFCADLYLVHWLEEKGFRYDVITDEDLHAEGYDLVAPYRTVITGSHPEYWTWEMRRAIDRYPQEGGRLMYLGGNGIWWVTGMGVESPHVMEVRKDDYSQSTPQLGAHPAELHLSTTGERGGTWRFRGLDPCEILGVSLTGEGWDRAGWFLRGPGSRDPRAAWIFDGIDGSGPIGDYGLALGGAAGDEYDGVNPRYGSPPNTLVLASSSGHSSRDKLFGDAYQAHALRDTRQRADLAYFEFRSGGAVFAAGSVTWTASLSHRGCNNDVSRITENVLRRFST